MWDLRTGPVRLTTGGLEGLGNLDFEVFTQDTAMLDGQRMTGWRGKPRDVLLPVLMGPFPDQDQYLKLSRLWWKIMHPRKVNTLTITAPDGTNRMLDLRFVNDGNGGMEKDPTRDLLQVFPMRMVADQPWFYGEDFGTSFTGAQAAEATDVNFYGGGKVVAGVRGKGTPLVLGKSRRDASSVLVNPGDADVWPEYEVYGPNTAFSSTIGSGVLGADSLPIVEGQTILVETSPLRQVAWLIEADGSRTNVTRRLSSWGFRPIPALDEETVNFQSAGAGGYRIRAIPHYFRGW